MGRFADDPTTFQWRGGLQGPDPAPFDVEEGPSSSMPSPAQLRRNGHPSLATGSDLGWLAHGPAVLQSRLGADADVIDQKWETLCLL